jgi:hypothetical protein
VVLDGTLSSVPVFEETLGNLEDGGLDGFDSSLDLDDSLGRLGKHFLGSDHSSARLVLDLLDLQSLSTDNGTHEVVGDQKSDRGEGTDGRRRKGRVGKGSLEQKFCDLGKGGSDTFDLTRDGEDSVLNTSDDLGDTSLDTGRSSDLSDGGTSFTDDDTGFLGRDKRSDGQGVLLVGVTSIEGGILGGLGGYGFCDVE